MGNCDPYSDSPEPVVVKQPKFTRVEEPTLLWNHLPGRNARFHVRRPRKLQGCSETTQAGCGNLQ